MPKLKTVAPDSVRQLIASNDKRGLVQALKTYSPDARLGAKGPTLLEVAAAEDQLALLDWLITSAKASTQDSQALLVAAEHGHTRCASSLLLRGFKPAAPTGAKGRTPLHAAAEHGYVRVAKELIDRGAAVNAVDQAGRTPLLACVDGARPGSAWHLEMAEVLLAFGADPALADRKRRTPLSEARRRGLTRLVKLLESKTGAERPSAAAPGKKKLKIPAAALLAIEKDQVRVLERFLESYSPEAKVDKKPNFSLMQLAVAHSRPRLVKLLLEHGADPNRRVGSVSYLWIACSQRDAAVARVLLEGGAQVPPPPKDNDSELQLAASTGVPELVEILLQHGADPNVKARWGSTPLHGATIFCDPNQSHAAGLLACARLLLNAGAEPQLPDDQGRTPIDWARGRKNTAMVALLEQPRAR